jgi:hypothetical protein
LIRFMERHSKVIQFDGIAQMRLNGVEM